jgi:hypothetical protein
MFKEAMFLLLPAKGGPLIRKHLAAVATYIPPLIVVLLMIGFAVQIANSQIEPIFDQRKLISPERTGYSYLESGVVSRLIVSAYNALRPYDAIRTNAGIRTAAMLLYLGAALLLFGASKHGRQGFVLTMLFIMLLVTSRFPFLWLSSELFAGAFLMLVLWSVVRKLPFYWVGLFAVLFTFTKPDLLLSGSLAALFLAVYAGVNHKARLVNLFTLVVLATILLLPGLVQEGAEVFGSEGRALFSFRQHYAALVRPHQATSDLPDPWQQWQPYFYPVWGHTESLPQLIYSNPAIYLDFLFLSLSQSLKNLARSNVLLLVPVAAYCVTKVRTRNLQILFGLFALGFFPITLLSFMHVRYLARFYPLLLFVIYLYLTKEKRQIPYWLILLFLVAVLVWQLSYFVPVLIVGYWFPD